MRARVPGARRPRNLAPLLWVSLGVAPLAHAETPSEAGDALPASIEITRPDEPILTAPNGSASRRGAALKGARLPVFAASAGPGCAAPWYAVGPIAWLCGDGAAPSALAPTGAPEAATADGLPFAYHFVGPDGTFGYRELEAAEQGVPDAQLLPGFGVAVARVTPKPGTAEPFGLTTHRLWLPMRDLGALVRAPDALAVDADFDSAAWVTAPRAQLYSAPLGQAKPKEFAAALTKLTVLERRERGKQTWLRVAPDTWIRERDTTAAALRPPPDGLRPNERWIDVDLARQTLVAYRGTDALFALPVSTGRGPAGTELATPPGLHRVWVKLRTSDMDNLENVEAERNYAIQAVPWVMYFDRGYALHGAFWHRAFGKVQSHGCVNLTPADAKRLFDWSSPRLPAGWSAVLPTDHELGTLVRVE